MAASDEIPVGVLSGTAQVPNRVVRLGGRVNFAQEPRAERLRELAGVAAVRLDPFARLARDQRRRHHDTRHSQRSNRALHRVATGTRLVAQA